MFNQGKYKILLALIFSMAVIAACGKKEPPVVDTMVSPVRIAVNSDFMPTAKLLAEQFTTNTGIGVEFSSGTDAELAQNIMDGDQIDVFMASDTEHPNKLVEVGKANSEGGFVYAFGTAALYSRSWKVNWTAGKYLKSGQFNKLALPSPEDNRYGKAGLAAIEIFGVYDGVRDKLVYTDNEAQSLELVNKKEADAGFIALSSISDEEKRWAWVVPQSFYEPIEQGAVLVNNEPLNRSANIWMGYLSSDAAQSIIRQSGYSILENDAVSSTQ